MDEPPISIQPTPNPLPTPWARAIANDIAERLTREGWQPEAKLRAWHPTGNPSGHHYQPPGGIPPTLPTTELISNNLYIWGSIDPDQYPGLNLPPLIYTLAQLDLAAVLTKQPDAPQLIHAAQTWLNKSRQAPRKHNTTPHPYRQKPNRHGNPRLQRHEYATQAEAQVFYLAAQAADTYTIDLTDYRIAINDPDFNATAALQIIEASMR